MRRPRRAAWKAPGDSHSQRAVHWRTAMAIGGAAAARAARDSASAAAAQAVDPCTAQQHRSRSAWTGNCSRCRERFHGNCFVQAVKHLCCSVRSEGAQPAERTLARSAQTSAFCTGCAVLVLACAVLTIDLADRRGVLIIVHRMKWVLGYAPDHSVC